MSRVEHLLILLPWLKRNQGVSVQEAASHFKLTEKQLVQDLMLLSVSGVGQYPGEQFDISYVDGDIYVRDSLGIDRPVKFDSMEAACLLLGLESLEMLPQTVSEFDQSDIESVRGKISSVLTHIPRIGFVEGSKSPNPETLDSVEQALRNSKQLRVHYWNNSRDDVTERIISPYSTRFDDGEVVLDAWCHHSDAWRSFRVERIREIEILETDVPDLSQTFAPMPVASVVIEVDEADRHLLEVLTWSSQPVEVDGKVRVSAAVAEPQWLARKIITAGGRMRILEPADFADLVKDHVHKALKAYS